MKLFFKTLIVATVVIILNSFYFEYCISRPFNIYLSFAIGLLVIGLDVWALIGAVKTLKKSLNL